MADNQEQNETRVTQTAEESAGADLKQVKPTADMSAKELKAVLDHEPNKELHPAGEPKKVTDKAHKNPPLAAQIEGLDAELHDPPLRSPHAGEKLIRTLATGAGAHTPPDPEKYDAFGRPRAE
jgi:hypothetical protein